MTEEKLIGDHQRALAIANNLKNLIGHVAAPDAQQLASSRWAFASALMQHLAIKERYLCAKLKQDSCQEVKAYFERSKADLLARFQSCTEHMVTWSTSSALAQWAICRVKAVQVVDIFLERLRQEESDLLVFVKRHGIDITTPSAATTNWTLKAFEVEDKVDDR